MILHIVNKSPYQSQGLIQSLQTLADKDSIILIEDGVYSLTNPAGLENLPGSKRLYALHDDCVARGIKVDANSATAVDYSGFVDLVANHEKSVSWF